MTPSGARTLTPRAIVEELDAFIISQDKAKRAVAIALRNRWRRRRVEDEMRGEILPNNIILIGPTGVGKTEIARRLADLAGAPFIKVEASRFTEVGYVGRDVESMIRDLVEIAVRMVTEEEEEKHKDKARARAEERLLDILLPPVAGPKPGGAGATDPADVEEADGQGRTGDPTPGAGLDNLPDAGRLFVVAASGETTADAAPAEEGPADDRRRRTRAKLRRLLREGFLDEREVDVAVPRQPSGFIDISEGKAINLGAAIERMMPGKPKRRRVTVPEAMKILEAEELRKSVDQAAVVEEALERAQEMGIVFLDEIDKVAGGTERTGPDVSREGVQRDLLPVVEGSAVQTRHGIVRTDHILFIAAGAFHVSKPSDLIPELQGRFPIRVELETLDDAAFARILREPRYALLRQYEALVASEGAKLEFTDDAIDEIARIASEVNQRTENIGARRLRTVLSTLLEDVLFDLPESEVSEVTVDAEFVHRQLSEIASDDDLRRYIL